MHAVLALTLAATLSGIVTMDGAPIPGCTITLVTADGVERKAITGAHGAYEIAGVPAGPSVVRFELIGLEPGEQAIDVTGEELVTVSQELKLPPLTETITLSCGGPPCNINSPESVWDFPACTDYELNSALIDALGRGDRSAAALLERRFAHASTWNEKHTIARALLGNLPNDGIYWSSLYAHAANAVRFPRVENELTAEFIAWCNERGLPPEDYASMAYIAFALISEEPRAKQLVHQSLASGDESLIILAIQALANARDLSALRAIEQALESLGPDLDPWLVNSLAYYEAPEADDLAMRVLAPDARRDYVRFRKQLAQERASGW